MGGSNMYCVICGGPTCSNFTDSDNIVGVDYPPSFDELPGVTQSDAEWIRTSVVVYADCITLPGEYDWGSYCVRPSGSGEGEEEEEEGGNKDDGLTQKQADSVERPAWAKEGHPGYAEYHVSPIDEDCFLAHDLCIRLAAVFSRAENPNRFSAEGRVDPAKFFWDANGPIPAFLCDAEMRWEDEVTEAFVAKSAITKEELGNPQQLDMGNFFENFNHGYDDEEDTSARAWLDGRGQEYEHDESFGITHLKRPDHFPDIHPLPTAAHQPVDCSNLFPARVPLDIIMTMLNDTESDYALFGPDIRALECVSRSWRNFFRTPLMQHHFWLKRVQMVEYIPNGEVDWTRSAQRVLDALSSEEGYDWRRYYNDARKSPNMKNRERIQLAVRALDHGMGNCDCRASQETEGHEEGEGADDA